MSIQNLLFKMPKINSNLSDHKILNKKKMFSKRKKVNKISKIIKLLIILLTNNKKKINYNLDNEWLKSHNFELNLNNKMKTPQMTNAWIRFEE